MITSAIIQAIITTAPWLAGANPPPPNRLPKVQSQTFSLHYQVNESALPLQAVTLWYTLDQGKSWHNMGRDEDAQSPVQFHAPEEGLYGFYFVMTNEAGASGPLPDSRTEPHSWAYVDFTPPMVQLIEARVDPAAGSTLSIRWTAVDSKLPARPVELAYRGVPAGEWVTIARDVANTGRYDWRLDPGIRGAVCIRIIVTDEGGHQAVAESEPIELPWETASSPSGAPTSSPLQLEQKLYPRLDERQRRILEQAQEHARKGEHRLALARYRDVLRAVPNHPDALMGLAKSLMALEELDSSRDAYASLLAHDPEHPAALRGLVEVLTAKKDFAGASQALTSLVQRQPNQVDGWLELGDLALFQGDRLSAMDFYQKAATLDPRAEQIITQAQARLRELRGQSANKSQTPDHP